MKLKLLTWDELAPEKKLKKPWWVKWKLDFILNTKFLALKHREICALVDISSVAAEQDSETIEITPEHLFVFGRMSETEFADAVEILSNYNVVKIISPKILQKSAENSPKILQISATEEKRRE